MEHFKWNNKYSVNNSELDNHHKYLFDMFNKMYDSCLNKNKDTIVGPILDELVTYIKYHFDAEEQHMKNIGYNDISNHISEHSKFTARINKHHLKKDINNKIVSKEIVLFLWKWLLDHVMTEDLKYAVKSNKRNLH
jgi:hemerythrin